MSSGKSEGRVCMPLRYLYPSLFFLDYWFRSVKQKGESEMSEEKKVWKWIRTSLRYSYLSQLLWYILLINTTEVERKERSVKGFQGEGGCMPLRYVLQSIRHLEIHSSINSYHILDLSDRWALRKMLQSSSVSHSNINTSVNFKYLIQISISQSTHLANSSDRPKRRGGEMSSGKSEGRVCMPLRYFTQIAVSQSSPVIYSSDQYHGSGKKRDEPWKNPERGGHQFFSVNSFNQFFRSAQQNGAIKR